MRKYIPKPLPLYDECKGCQADHCAYASKIHEYCPCQKCLVKPTCSIACRDLRNIVHQLSEKTSFIFIEKDMLRLHR